MLNKHLILAGFFAMFCHFEARGFEPQVVTSEVYFDKHQVNAENNIAYSQDEFVEQKQYNQVPVWPLVGSDADVNLTCDKSGVGCEDNGSNIQVISKIGDDLVVENNFEGDFFDDGNWSGGANMLHGLQTPAGFMDECNTQAEMPLMTSEMLEDDGGNVLVVSRSGRKKCIQPDYFAKSQIVESVESVGKSSGFMTEFGVDAGGVEAETQVALSADADAALPVKDQVRSWVVESGTDLRLVLQKWCDKEGWDLVWATSREYPIEASAIFKGRFVDVSSALVRNFARVAPVPYAKFYKGNRVVVISTID